MKQVLRDRIINKEGSDIFEPVFSFDRISFQKGHQKIISIEGLWKISVYQSNDVSIVFMEELLSLKKNENLLEKIPKYPAMWSEVYSPKDELHIFTQLFEFSLREKQKIHIVWVTLGQEVEMLENYYRQLGFFDEENNTFKVDFSLPLISVSVKIENIMWRGSDYKRMGKKLFVCPPIREAWEVKNMYKWINRGVIAGIYFSEINFDISDFLQTQIQEEHILALTLWKLLKYNYEQIGFEYFPESTLFLSYETT